MLYSRSWTTFMFYHWFSLKKYSRFFKIIYVLLKILNDFLCYSLRICVLSMILIISSRFFRILQDFSCFIQNLEWSYYILLKIYSSFINDFDEFFKIFQDFSSYLILSDPLWSYLILSDPIWSYLILSDPFWSYLILSDPIWPYLTLSDPIWPYLILSDPIWSYLILSDPI